MTTIPHNPPGEPGQTTAGLTSPAPAAPRRRPTINVRMILFVLIVSAPFVYIVGSAVMYSITGGITDRGAYKEVDLKALGNFPFNAEEGSVEQVPPQYRSLDGQRVMLRGFMFQPEDVGAKGRRFQFVYDVNKCCFNGPPLVQERVFAHAKQDAKIYDQYTLADVVGVLRVRPIKEPATGKVISLFDLDVESTKPVDG